MTLTKPAVALPALDAWLAAGGGAVDQVAPALAALAQASIGVARSMACAPLLAAASPEASAPDPAQNPEADRRTALEAVVDRAILGALQGAGVAWLASGDDDAILTLDPRGHLAIAVAHIGDPSDIAANVATGTLFAIFPASADGATASFLRSGDDLLAAGCIIHGAHTALTLTARDGVATFVLDPAAGVFRLTRSRAQVAPQARDLAVDMSSYRYWHHPVRLLVDDCMAGADGPRGVDYSFRGTTSLVAETHRILAAGGVYIDPPDHRVGRQSGGVRLVYEAFAIALLMEQAGGAASDTHRRILSRTANDLRQHTPLVFGSAAGVKLVDDYHLGPTARLGEAPLFGRRGLYRK
jgi:fructose-1,6-bisphosphatase I